MILCDLTVSALHGGILEDQVSQNRIVPTSSRARDDDDAAESLNHA